MFFSFIVYLAGRRKEAENVQGKPMRGETYFYEHAESLNGSMHLEPMYRQIRNLN
jgi:hypothetical protein